MLNIVQGSLLDAKEKYIAHQCNCLTTGAAGVARLIFEAFPYSDVYSSRDVDAIGRTINPDEPATIKILGNGVDQRYVINMFSQYYPGGPSEKETAKTREKYFHKCLLILAMIPELDSIAFPYKIGCGLAGGNWKYYFGTLRNFAEYLKDVQVTIYCPTEQDYENAKLDYKSL